MIYYEDNISFNKMQNNSFDAKYKIKKLIGQGGAGTIFLVECCINNKIYTCKCIDKSRNNLSYPYKKFMKEVNILISLTQQQIPNTLTYIDHLEDDKYYYLITNYIDGISLNDLVYGMEKPEDDEDIIENEIYEYNKIQYDNFGFSSINPKEYYKIFKYIITKLNQALIYFKKNNIIHNDFIPINIMIYKYFDSNNNIIYEPIIIDFGMSANHQINDLNDEINLKITIDDIISRYSKDDPNLLKLIQINLD